MGNCDYKCNPCLNEDLIKQLLRETENLSKNTTAKLLIQDKKIAETIVYIKEHLSDELREMFDSMKLSGEIDKIIMDMVFNELNELKFYYTDNLIHTEKFSDSTTGCDYYVTTVKKYDENGNRLALKLAIANDNENANSLESPVNYAHRTNASLVINGGIYNTSTHRPLGIFILNGKVLNNETLTDPRYRYLGIDKRGNLHCFPYTTTADEMLSFGMIDVFCSFTDLIIDGKIVELSDKTNLDPRQSIGQLPNGDYVFVTVDGRTREDLGFTYPDLARVHQQLGCSFAVALDGGGSSSTVVRGIKQNDDIDSSFDDRAVSNFLYITKPNNYEPSLNPFNSIGWLKQRLSKYMNTFLNFDKGYIRLRAPKGQHHPGIEIYTDGETERSAKIGFTSAVGSIRRILFSMLDTDGVQKNVFAASPSGLMDINGYLAHWNRKPVIINDCNSIKNTGLYRVTKDTLNKPYECTIGFILHVSIYDESDKTNGNSREIFFSKDKDIMLTRTIAENGAPAEWRPLANMKCTSSARPEGFVGMMCFDTTIKKPIWYNGTEWVDSTGTAV